MSSFHGYDTEPAAFHEMLLRGAGRLPDALVSVARGWLAEGHYVEIAEAVAFAALAGRVPLPDTDISLLRWVLDRAGRDNEELADLLGTGGDPMPLFGMAPVGPHALAEYSGEMPYGMDLTDGDHVDGLVDDIDAAAVRALVEMEGGGPAAVGMWRAWRYPARPTPWPRPRRVYLVQADVDDPAQLPMVTAWVQEALAGVGEPDPQVETFVEPSQLPTYQRTALAFGALLWTARPAWPIRMVEFFDEIDGSGAPRSAPGQSTVDGDERDDLLRYLEGGTPLLVTRVVTDDDTGDAVPMTFRTDGAWVWTDTCIHRLATHGLVPDLDLLDHVRQRGYQSRAVDAIDVHRALAALYHSVPEDAVG